MVYLLIFLPTSLTNYATLSFCMSIPQDMFEDSKYQTYKGGAFSMLFSHNHNRKSRKCNGWLATVYIYKGNLARHLPPYELSIFDKVEAVEGVYFINADDEEINLSGHEMVFCGSLVSKDAVYNKNKYVRCVLFHIFQYMIMRSYFTLLSFPGQKGCGTLYTVTHTCFWLLLSKDTSERIK